MVDVNKVDKALDAIDKTVGALVPLVGTIGGLARLFISMAQKQGLDTTTFEAQIAKFDAQHADLHSAVNEFRTLFPRAGEAPGSTTIGG